METIHDVSCPSFLYIAVAICSAFVFYKYCYPRNSPPLPPGPVGLPVIGNLHQFTGSRDPLDTIKKWHQQYGPIISFRAGQRTIIVVSSYKIAHDMLDNHGAIYSSRPEFVIALKHLSRNMFMGAMPHNRKWQSRRRIMTSLLGPTMSKRYQYLQDIESKQIVHEFLTSHDFSLSFERHVTSVAFTLAYGMRLENVKRAEISEMRHILHTLMDGLENLTMGMVELFPILDHLPHFLAPWNKFWRERHNHTLSFYLRGLEYSRTEQKKLPWTWTRETTRALQHTGEMSDAEIAYFVGSMNEGAIESTPKIMRSAIKAFLLYPAVAQRAQQELDDIIGSDRLPTFEDRPRLPYFNALIKEVLRWQPLLPLGMPHSTDTDQLYMGYRIPQGSIILQNNYEMAYNVCHEPYNFKPERWLENPDLQVFSAFGYGHRRCPGEYLANNTLFIVLSRILWAYNIRHAIRDGQTVEVDEWDIRRHFTAAPAPFEVVFELRDDTESRRRIIEQEFQSMEKDASRILQKIAPESKS